MVPIEVPRCIFCAYLKFLLTRCPYWYVFTLFFRSSYVLRLLSCDSQKTMLLVEEKQVPIKIELVPMRSYGDKPQEFLRKVPGGLLPAIEINGQVITECV